MLHAKSLVVDGRFVSVGAMNYDRRSIALNDESCRVALDEELGREVEAMFGDDLARAAEIRAEDFARRPLGERARERGATLVARQV